jgi:hypothetical protein
MIVEELGLKDLVVTMSVISTEISEDRVHIRARQVALLSRKGNGRSDGEVPAFVFVEDSGEDGWRIEVRNAVAFHWKIISCSGHDN